MKLHTMFFCKLAQAIKMHWFSDSTAYNFFAITQKLLKNYKPANYYYFLGGGGGTFLVCFLKFPYIFILVGFFFENILMIMVFFKQIRNKWKSF